MPEYTLRINGVERKIDTQPDRPLLDVLREDLALTGAKYGCGENTCRACVVLVDDRPVTTCRLPVEKAANKNTVTIEGLAQDDKLHPVQEAFIAEGAMQCGYCVPGMVLTAVALLRQGQPVTRERIVEFMNGNICRCCNYPNLVRAIERAATS